MVEVKTIETKYLWPNTGQIKGLPTNPRFIKDDKFEKLKQSISDDPEFMSVREIVVFPYAGDYVIIGGNMRFRACVDLGIKSIVCKVLPENTSIEKLKAFLMKDNIAFGSTDWNIIANEWDEGQLIEWGMDIPVSFGDEDPNDEEETKLLASISRITIELSHDNNKELIKAHINELLRDFTEATMK
ncbi:ParB N-terminal domain-containing protein [Sphingobacterium anhuiense]|uniref:ParB N-terminal domain-containing protein n=1 Tax=Sphingobacterium anhuiense TaxID=493780 RepID=UPI003C305A8A